MKGEKYFKDNTSNNSTKTNIRNNNHSKINNFHIHKNLEKNSNIQNNHKPYFDRINGKDKEKMFFNRLNFTDLAIVLLIYLESFFTFILKLIPRPIVHWLTSLINFTANINDETFEEKLRSAPTIHEMCSLFNIHVEDHIIRTEDNYLLTIHRIPPLKEKFNGKVVYLHHGLLMCSDVWCCQIERHKNLPFLLHDMGFDVWLGNNRGNKYSAAHLYFRPKEAEFWNFSIDEFAFFDIPNTIEFIIEYAKIDKLILIGFSQGSAQIFAALSVNEKINNMISHMIAIAPAMTPKRLHNIIADTFAKSSPRLMYLFFGRNIVLPSAVIWQRSTHPHVFTVLIDICNRFLFNWKSNNIKMVQKKISYAKLYSTTSVKCIVHWFQILRSQKFQFFEESDDVFNSLSRPYQVPSFPTRTNIKVPILLIYGGSDLLVDIDVMKRNLPKNFIFDIKVDNHEHLDLIWGDEVDSLVFNKVIKFIDFFDNLTTITTSSCNNLLKDKLRSNSMYPTQHTASPLSIVSPVETELEDETNNEDDNFALDGNRDTGIVNEESKRVEDDEMSDEYSDDTNEENALLENVSEVLEEKGTRYGQREELERRSSQRLFKLYLSNSKAKTDG